MPTSFLQSSGWARLKQAQGWQVHRLAGFLGLQRDLPLGVKLLYLPELGFRLQASGFKVTGLRLKRLLKEIQKVAKQKRLTVARLEFFTEFDEADTKAIARADHFLAKAGLQKSPEEMQPEYRQLIDLTLPEERLLAQMKPKGRYNIKIAKRHGVVVQQIQKSKFKNQNYHSSLKDFYKVYEEAAKRDGFTPRPFHYFEQMATHMSGHVSSYIASWKGKPLAAAVIIFWQGRASYLYGGSSSAHRNVMAPYLLHWNIIQDAKAAGLKTYDLLAISPGGVDRHKFSGLRRFKEQFGGRSVRVLGSYDLIVDPLRYKLFVITEKLRGRF
ncbi:MAG: peptidoglycan bridge formation glycyltransferase FemA/FemB family protein [Patescibacteria group bacterium]